MRAVHNVEMEKRKRGRPRKLYEHIELDEYMPTVAEKENAFDRGDENEHAIINQVEDAPGCGATKQRQHDEWGGVKRDLRTVPCKICGKVLSNNSHWHRHMRAVHKVDMRAVHKVEMEKWKRAQPRKPDECIELDEYMSMVAEKENDFDHDDDNEYAITQVEDAPKVAVATKQSQDDEWGGVKRVLGTVPCKICGKVLAKNGHLDRHMKSVHKVEVEKRKRGKPKGVEQKGDSEAKTSRNDRQKVVCDLCGKTVSSKGLAAHKDMHMVERTIKCEFQGCNKYFRTNKELKR